LFAERRNDLNGELDTELMRKSKLELDLRDDQADPVSYELVRSLMERFDELLCRSPFQQRKTLLHLIVKKIKLDDKRRVKDIVLAFNEETEKHFLNIAPSADSTADGAFLVSRKAPMLNQSLYIVI
jgi:site-specific DNA recombinase